MFKNSSNKSRIPMPLKVLFFLGMATLFVFILGNLILYLWNGILVDAAGVNVISFWQAIGIFALTRILFGGFRFGHRPKNRKRNRGRKMREKWMSMSEEERTDFKDNWKDWCKKRD